MFKVTTLSAKTLNAVRAPRPIWQVVNLVLVDVRLRWQIWLSERLELLDFRAHELLTTRLNRRLKAWVPIVFNGNTS